MLNTRPATISDMPFLAQIMYEASLPPHNHSFWDEMLEGSQTSALDFLAAALTAQASNWGNVEDFMVAEIAGESVAAAAGYQPNFEDYRPLKVSEISAIAKELGWSHPIEAEVHRRYTQLFSDNPRPVFLHPQAPWIIESVAVLPDARGQGVGKTLLRALLKAGRDQGQSHAGIMIINGNERARKTYESLGFKPYQTFHADYFREQFGVEFSGITKFGLCLSSELE
ncbi:MAG: GNAT family N-acetyltransferase [Cyanobacteria bacterium P01_A01_bin.17]